MELSGALNSPSKPAPAVRPGDRVGIAALSGPVDPESLERGLATLAELGFEPVPAANLAAQEGLFAGSDDDRLRAFHELAAEPSIAGIVFARGGHGILRLLDGIDWRLLARRPRVYMGYSDVTPFLNQVVEKLGIASVHGPMVAVDLARPLAAEERDSLRRALAGELPATLTLEGAWGDEVVAPLKGGCLSLLTATLGTRHAVDLEGSILFWEDVDEPLYRIDRMLTQLRLSGTLRGLKGMVTGRFDPPSPTSAGSPSLAELLGELSDRYGWPVGIGCSSGHCTPNLCLPLGLPARLDTARAQLTVEPVAGV